MLDYIDGDQTQKHGSKLRISGAIVLIFALFLGGAYLVKYGLPSIGGSAAHAQAPTPEPTMLPTPTPHPGAFHVNPTDLVLPLSGQFGATGTNLHDRLWLRQVPMRTLKQYIYNWTLAHHTEYAQIYYLSCEAAVIRLTLAPFGIHLTEDQILDTMPFHPDDPELGMVIEEIDGSTFYWDGTINWGNYGAHAPVIAKMLDWYLAEYGLDDFIAVEVQALDDIELAALIRNDPDLLGVVIWVARGPDGGLPPTNDRGQVLGEHVQWVAPVLDDDGMMLVFDVWPWPNQPFHVRTTLNRQLFQNRTVLIRRVNK